jgi:hypothetical protein
MSNIVERLRELEAVESELACECDCPPEATANYRYAMTCAEAADEIARLRADRDAGAKDYCALMERYDALRNQIAELVEALRRLTDRLTEDFDGGRKVRRGEIEKARAVIAKVEGHT